MSKFWHILATIGLAALTVVTPPLQAVILAHPYLAATLGVAWTILGNLLQSPIPPKK